jgi:putative ubiquitin-RnfH superfamily antitoxin RatB of RatAB toxin-antitoxin module
MTFRVEICAVWPGKSIRQEILVSRGQTIDHALTHVGLTEALRQAAREANAIGVFGEPRERSEPLMPGDRIELWRGLIADPKEARRERAKIETKARAKARLERQRARRAHKQNWRAGSV